MIGLISFNYKNTPLEIREKLYLDDNDKSILYKIFNNSKLIKGTFIISTCNRTEVYFECKCREITKIIHFLVASIVNYKKYSESVSPYIQKKIDHEVIKHIFSLACGLKSMLIGEYQIVDQIKKSYAFAIKKKTLSPILNRLIQKCLNASKFVRTNTNIDKGAVSVSYAAVEKINSFCNNKQISIANIGIGNTGKLTLEYLLKKKYKNITIINRTLKVAKDISKEYNIKYSKIENLSKIIQRTDVLIFSTSSTKKLITATQLTDTIKNKKKKLFIVDLGVPTNVSKDVRNIKNITLFNIENLKDEVNKNYKKRKKEIGKAKKIIFDLSIEFEKWVESRNILNKINKIKNNLNKTKQDPISKEYIEKKLSKNNKGTLKLINNILSSYE